MEAPVAQKHTIFVTVHGTWAGKAGWAQPDSLLGRAVLASARERGESATIEPFVWSGKNSVAARQEAGGALGRRVMELRRQNPFQPIYVIAHSHGGSVFAYALKKEPRLGDHVDGFIALATPWIAVRPWAYATALRSLLLYAFLYLLLLPAMLAAGRASTGFLEYMMAQRPLSQDQSSDPLGGGWVQGWTEFADAMAMWGLSYLLAGLAVGVVWYVLNGRLARWLDASAQEFVYHTAADADSVDTLVQHQLPPSVFFRPTGDEAALALAWTSGMASLMQAASQLLFFVLHSVRRLWLSIPRYGRILGSGALVVGWAVGTAVLVFFMILADGSVTLGSLTTVIREMLPRLSPGRFDMAYVILDVPAVFALAVWAGVALALLSLGAVTLVAWLAAAGAGIPTLRAALFMRITVEATPLGIHQLVLVDVSTPPPQGGVESTALSHSSLYESANVIAAVLSAVQGFPERTSPGQSRRHTSHSSL